MNLYVHNKVLGITNDFPGPSNSKIYGLEKKFDTTKPDYRKQSYYAISLGPLVYQGSTVLAKGMNSWCK